MEVYWESKLTAIVEGIVEWACRIALLVWLWIAGIPGLEGVF